MVSFFPRRAICYSKSACFVSTSQSFTVGEVPTWPQVSVSHPMSSNELYNTYTWYINTLTHILLGSVPHVLTQPSFVNQLPSTLSLWITNCVFPPKTYSDDRGSLRHIWGWSFGRKWSTSGGCWKSLSYLIYLEFHSSFIVIMILV